MVFHIFYTLISLTHFFAALHSDLFAAAWNPIASSSRNLFKSANSESSDLLVAVLKVFNDQFKENSSPRRHLRELIGDSTGSAIEQCEALLRNPEEASVSNVSSLPLTNLIDKFGEVLFGDADIMTVGRLIRFCISE